MGTSGSRYGSGYSSGYNQSNYGYSDPYNNQQYGGGGNYNQQPYYGSGGGGGGLGPMSILRTFDRDGDGRITENGKNPTENN
jgi:hypothetical protein